jgi:uncharacterized delta-60 repeat protein
MIIENKHFFQRVNLWHRNFFCSIAIVLCMPLSSLSAHAFDSPNGANGNVQALALQPDGRVLIGGFFDAVSDVLRNGIARLNTDGSVDLSFNPGDGVNSGVLALALQPDGKVLIGGYFSQVNGVSHHGIARLNADGSVDSTFNPVTEEGNYVTSLVLQPDGKVLAGGRTGFSSNDSLIMTRLNTDGSLDLAFNSGISGGKVTALALQPNGKVLVVNYNVSRLNANGSLDPTFSSSIVDPDINALALQPDGKVLVGGSRVDNTSVVRLNADGSLDSTFNTTIDRRDVGEVDALALQSNGKVLMGGIRVIRDEIRNDRITPVLARLNADGSLDDSFNIVFATGDASHVYAIALQPNRQVLVGGFFNRLNRELHPGVARLKADGTLIKSISAGDEMCLPIIALNEKIAVVCL